MSGPIEPSTTTAPPWGGASSWRATLSAALVLAACLPDNPHVDMDGETSTSGETSTTTDPGSDGGGARGLLGCAAGERCTFVLVAESLDDRVEVFSPFADPVYRGTIDVDLDPGSDLGLTADNLDEPFGLTIAGGSLHLTVGHHPRRAAGSLVSFPLELLAEREPGGTVPVSAYFAGGVFQPPVTAVELGRTEAIFVLPEPLGAYVWVGVFANDLFDVEANWTAPGELLAFDPRAPEDFGVAPLVFGDDACAGAAQLVPLADDRLAIACDGNDAIAFVTIAGTAASAAEAVANLEGTVCPVPSATARRVRQLAPDGVGGVLVAQGPSALLDDANVYRIGPACELGGPVEIASDGRAVLGAIVPSRFAATTWLLASGGPLEPAERGVFPIRATGGSTLERCSQDGEDGLVGRPIAGLDDAWRTAGSQRIGPLALATTSDGRFLAVGAGAADVDADDGMLGKVLWAELTVDPGDPCAIAATFVDWTDGAPGHAPRSDAALRPTWRRAPNVVTLLEVDG